MVASLSVVFSASVRRLWSADTSYSRNSTSAFCLSGKDAIMRDDGRPSNSTCEMSVIRWSIDSVASFDLVMISFIRYSAISSGTCNNGETRCWPMESLNFDIKSDRRMYNLWLHRKRSCSSSIATFSIVTVHITRLSKVDILYGSRRALILSKLISN